MVSKTSVQDGRAGASGPAAQLTGWSSTDPLWAVVAAKPLGLILLGAWGDAGMEMMPTNFEIWDVVPFKNSDLIRYTGLTPGPDHSPSLQTAAPFHPSRHSRAAGVTIRSSEGPFNSCGPAWPLWLFP